MQDKPTYKNSFSTVQLQLVVRDNVMGKLVACKILLQLTLDLNNSSLHEYNNSSHLRSDGLYRCNLNKKTVGNERQ